MHRASFPVDDDWRWCSPPRAWSGTLDELVVHAAPATDFWRTTHYGFVRHSGHVYARTIRGDFVLTAWVEGDYAHQYDQAGLMIELDDEHWLKAGVEHVDGVTNISAVMTHGTSDWSRVELLDPPRAVAVQVERRGDALHARWSADGSQWTEYRLGWFEPGRPVRAGIMAAAPQGPGFTATFRNIDLRAYPSAD